MRVFTLTILLAFLFSSCAFKKTTQFPGLRTESPKASKIEPEARGQFFQAERQFYNRDYDKALRNYQQIKTKFPRGKAGQLASYRTGSILYYREDYSSASREFESFLAHHPNSELDFDVTYNLAASEFQQQHFEKAYDVLNRLKPADIQSQGPRRAEIIYQLKGQVASSLGRPNLAIQAFASKAQLPISQNEKDQLEETIETELSRITNIGELQTLENEITESGTKAKIQQRIAALTASPVAEGGEPSSQDLGSAPVAGSSSGDRLSVGVVLPLTGRFAPYGKKALDAILLAAQVYRNAREIDFQLHVMDTKSNPSIAGAAVETLAQEHQVMAILGPLSWREALVVAEKSQNLGIVNLSLSAKEGISERGGYLFQNALTPRVQLESLVQFCVQQRGFRRFAILAPTSAFGKDMVNEFWELVEKSGGKITAYSSYSPDEKDFQDSIQELVGLDPKYRRFEMSKLAEYAKEQKAKTGREPKTKLVPIVDFDAIFIPDNPKTVATIAPSLAYFDVVDVALLGTTEWNTDLLYKRGGRYVEGALFPGALSASSQNANQKEFIRSYVEAYGSAPDLLSGQAFEAMHLIQASLRQSNSASRSDLANALASMKDFASPLGSLSFDNTRIAKRRVPIHQIGSAGNITQVQ